MRRKLGTGFAVIGEPETKPLEDVMKSLFQAFVSDESGATAIEYGLIAALISVALIGGATALGTGLNTQFTTISGNL